MKKLFPLFLISLFPLFINSCSNNELRNEEAKKIISEYYHFPFQTKIAIDILYDSYGWPPEKYNQLVNQGLITIKPRNSGFMSSRFQAIATENARQYWIQNATMETSQGKVWLLIFKGYRIDLTSVSISSNAKENKAEAEVVLAISDISPIQNIFSPLKQTEIKGTINFKLYDDGWKVVEDENSKRLFQPIVVPLHWAEKGQIIFDNTPLFIAQPEPVDSGDDTPQTPQ